MAMPPVPFTITEMRQLQMWQQQHLQVRQQQQWQQKQWQQWQQWQRQQHQHQHQHKHWHQQPQAAAKQYQAQAEDLALPVAESNEAGHHLQTEEELGRMLQEQLARIRSSWSQESRRSRETSEVGAEEAALCVARSQVGQVARRGGLPPTPLPLC